MLSRSSKGVDLAIKNNNADDISNEHFDHLVMCVLADDALKILADMATGREKRVLGSAAFYDDLTVTHSDSAYFNRQYETSFQSELCAEPKSEEQCHQIATAKGESISSSSSSPSNGSEQFNPMYYTYTYQHDPRLIEMSFNCSNYQHQFKESHTGSAAQPEPVYQTIFLDKRKSDLWTIDGIDESKIIKRNWWHQLGHRWQHYLQVVPCMMFLQGRNNTFFAGSWTLVVCCLFPFSIALQTASHNITKQSETSCLIILIPQNMHEVACISGIAAAYRLGADYTKFDDFAQDFFAKYLLLSHGKFFSREEKKRKKGKTV